MRHNLTKKNSTRSERLFHEVLKEMKIPFKHRWIINGYEIDFVINQYAVELDGHKQNPLKNHKLVELGYTPIHFDNKIIRDKKLIKNWLKNLNY